MTQNEIRFLASSPLRKKLKWCWAALLLAIICVNTPAQALGHWIFGATVAMASFLLERIRILKRSIRLGKLTKVERSGALQIEAEGIHISVMPNQIQASRFHPKYTLINGTSIVFEYDKEGRLGV